MMEGISSEAFSLAGTLGLGKLIVLYDSNRISIEGSTDIAFRENVEERMKAFGFQTITVEDGTDIDAIGAAIEVAKADTEHPSFITIKTEIGFGCPAKQGKASAHGEPLGVDNIKAMRLSAGSMRNHSLYRKRSMSIIPALQRKKQTQRQSGTQCSLHTVMSTRRWRSSGSSTIQLRMRRH